MEFILSILTDFWKTVSEMAPYLLFGFAAAGLISVFISPAFVEKHLGGKGPWPLIKASLFGIPLPLCSCGVIPVAMSLRKHGASKGATISFLLSTPQTGIDSLFVTLSLLGPIFAIFRPIITFITGLVGGAAIEIFENPSSERHGSSPQCEKACCNHNNKQNIFIRAAKYGFVTLPRDIAEAMFIGLIIAAAISSIIPPDYFAPVLGGGIFAMIVMMIVGIPVYVCATASVPIAAALIAKGVSPGVALVFLMTGPATNAAGIATIWKVLGHKTAIVYLITVAACALLAGLALDAFALTTNRQIVSHIHWMLPPILKHISAFVLLTVLAVASFEPKPKTTPL
ncbi:MAG: SO_0444 family Cu/Zn efflux transporter [Planctomycetota bacterium]